jgi:hypothetical protein
MNQKSVTQYECVTWIECIVGIDSCQKLNEDRRPVSLSTNTTMSQAYPFVAVDPRSSRLHYRAFQRLPLKRQRWHHAGTF